MERKTFPSLGLKIIDEGDDQGIVEHIFAVFGNLDEGFDILHPGSFTKTVNEQGQKVKVLDAHRTDSLMRVIAKPLSMREVGKDELPQELLAEFPDANGGVWARTQFLMDTPEGKGAFSRIKAGAIDEWSFAYDAVDVDHEKVTTKEGEEVTARNIRTLKLYEYSPVLWGMNPATRTISAKKKPTEGKPYGVFEQGDKWEVYKVDEDGEPVGDVLGTHDTEDEAQEQIQAILANEEEENSDDKELGPQGPIQRLSDVLQGSIHREFTLLCDNWYVEGYLTQEERISLSGLIGDALGVLAAGIPEEIGQREVFTWGYMGTTQELDSKVTDEDKQEHEAGPDGNAAPPTFNAENVLRQIDSELLEIEMLEV